LASITSTSKSGVVIRKVGPDAAAQIRPFRDRLIKSVVSGSSPEQQTIAKAFGYDGIGHSVPPRGLENLVADLEAGSLSGLIMLQSLVKVGSKPGGRFDVEYSTSADMKNGVLKAKVSTSEPGAPNAPAVLKAIRDDLQASAKRVIQCVESVRRVKVASMVLSFTVDSNNSIFCIGGYGIRSTLSEGEISPQALLTLVKEQPKPLQPAIGSGAQLQRPGSSGNFDSFADLIAESAVGTLVQQTPLANIPPIPIKTRQNPVSDLETEYIDSSNSTSRSDPFSADAIANAGYQSQTSSEGESLFKRVSRPGSEQQKINSQTIPTTSAVQSSRSSETSLASLRASGRFDFVEEKISENADKSVLLDTIRRLQLKWKDAVSLAEEVNVISTRDREESVKRLKDAHNFEMKSMKAAFESLEERVFVLSTSMEQKEQEATDSSRREASAMEKLSRAMADNLRLSEIAARNAATTSTATINSLPQGASTRDTRSAGRSSLSRSAGAQIVGGISANNTPSASQSDEIAGNLFSDANVSAAGFSAAPTSTGNVLIRNLQFQLDVLKDQLANESKARSELSESNKKLIEDFRLERQKLKSQVSALEEVERNRVSSSLVSSLPNDSGNAVEIVMQKVRETEILQQANALLKSQLSESQDALAKAVSSRLEVSARAETLSSAYAALDAELKTHRLAASSGTFADSGLVHQEILRLNQQLSAERASNEQTIQRLVNDMRQQVAQAQNNQARAVEEAQAAVREEISRLSSTSTMAAVKAEADKWAKRLEEHERELEVTLGFSQKNLTDMYEKQRENLQTENQRLSNDLEAIKAELNRVKGRPSTSTISTRDANDADLRTENLSIRSQLKNSELTIEALKNDILLAERRITQQNEDFSLRSRVSMEQHSMELAKINEILSLAQRRFQEDIAKANAETESVKTTSEKQLRANEAELEKSRSLLSETAARSQTAFEQLKAAAEKEVQEARAQAQKQVQYAIEEAEKETVKAVENSLSRARQQWSEELKSTLAAKIQEERNSAREEYQAKVAQLSMSAEGQNVAQAELFRRAETQWAMQVQSIQAESAKEIARLSTLLEEVQTSANSERELLRSQIAKESRKTEEIMRERADDILKAAKERSALSQRLLAEKDSAIEIAVSQAAAKFEEDLKAAQKKSVDDVSKVASNTLAEADRVVHLTREDAMREKQMALDALQRQHAFSMNEILGKQAYLENSLREAESFRSASVAEFTSQIHTLKEALVVAENSAEVARADARIIVDEAKTSLEGEIDKLRSTVASQSNVISQLRSSQAETAARSQTAFEQLKAAAEKEVQEARAQAQKQVQYAIEEAEKETVKAVENSLSRARQQWSEELKSTLAAKIQEERNSAREEYQAKVAQLSMSAEGQNVAQAELFRRAETQWAMQVQSIQAESAKEIARLSTLLEEVRAAADIEREALREHLASETREMGVYVSDRAEDARKAASERAAIEQRLLAEKESAVLSAIAETKKNLSDEFELERQAFMSASSNATSRVFAEADKVVATAQREKEEALKELQAQHKYALDQVMNRANEIGQRLQSERDQILAENNFAHQREVSVLKSELATLKEGYIAAEQSADIAKRENQTLLETIKAEHEKEIETLRKSSLVNFTSQMTDLETKLQQAREERDKTIVQSQAAFNEVRLAAEREVYTTRADAQSQLQVALEAAQQEASLIVQASVERAREDWKLETSQAVYVAVKSARAEFAEQLTQLAASADGKVSSQAEFFRQSEAQFTQQLQAVQADHARETKRLNDLILEARAEIDSTRAALQTRDISHSKELEKIMLERSLEVTAAGKEKAALEQRLVVEKSDAVKAAVSEQAARFDSERRAVQAAAEEASSRLIFEANQLVSKTLADKEKALTDADNQYKITIERLYQDAMVVQKSLQDEKNSAIQALESEKNRQVEALEITISELSGRLSERDKNAKRELDELQSTMTQGLVSAVTESEKLSKEKEAQLTSKISSLQSDNEQAASIIAGLLRESEAASRRSEESSQILKANQVAHAVALAEISSQYEATLQSLTKEGNARASQLELELKQVSESLEDRLSKAQASWTAEKAQLQASHTSEVTQLVAIAQQSEGAALAAVEEIRQRFSQQQQGDLQNIQKAFESEIESLRRTHSEEIDSLKRDRASLERRLLDDKDVSVRGAVESALSDLTAKFDAERRAFQRASEEATSKVISEANDLVSNARLSAATDKENALADLQASHKAAVEQLYRQAYDAQSLLSNERDRALQLSASQLESTVSKYESQLNSMKEIVISAEASADRAKEEARVVVDQAREAFTAEAEKRIADLESAWIERSKALQNDNEQAATIISNLIKEGDDARRRADDTLSALRELQEASAKELSDRSAQYEASIASLRSQTQEGNARASQLELELKQVSESLEDRLSKAQASWIAEKAQLEATHTSEVTQLVAIAQQSEGAALAAVEEIRQRFSQQQQGDLQNIQKAFESEIESLRRTHSEEIDSLKRDRASLERRLLDDKDVSVRGAVESALSDLTAKFDAERRAFQRASEEATSKVISEANDLVSNARLSAATDKENALADLQASHKAAVEQLYRQAYDAQSLLSNERDRALQDSASQLESTVSRYESQIRALKMSLISAEASADRAKEEARVVVDQAREAFTAEAEKRIADLESAWIERSKALQNDNEQAATIISNLIKEGDDARRRADDTLSALRELQEASAKELSDRSAQYEASIASLRSQTQEGNARASQLELELKQVSESLEDRLSKAQASWIAEKAQLEATHTSEVTQLVAIAQQSEGAALAAVEEIRQRFSQQQQGDLQNIQKAFESEIESLRRTHSEEIDSLKRDRASLERRLLDDKDVSVRGAVESALSDLTAKFDAERRAFQRASEEATSKVISEANDLVSNARLSAATDKENALADLQASHKAAVEQLYRQAYDAQSLLSNERDRALQDSASQLESTVSKYESQLNSMKEIVISAEASADRAKEEARVVVDQAREAFTAEAEKRIADLESAWIERSKALQNDNEQAATIISNLIKEGDDARRRADDTLSALRELQEASAKELSDRSAQYEASIASLRSQTQEGNARASQLELELKQVSESLEDRLSKAQASWIAEKAQLEATHTSEVTQLVAIAQQSEGAALAAVEEIRQRFSQQQQGDLQNIQKAFESEIESLRRTHSEEIDSLKRDRASLERRLLDDKDVSVRGAVESALSDLTAKFDAERRAFQRASEEATSKVISEANDLVSNARLSAATDKENALADLQASHKAAVEQLYRQAYDAQSLLSNERDRALQLSASQLESTVSKYESQLNSMKEIVISAEASADRAKEEARVVVDQAREAFTAEAEKRIADLESAWIERSKALQNDNEQAATIISNLIKEGDDARRRADDTLSALRELQEASAKELSDRSAQYEASIASLRSQTQEGNARASQLELELKQVSESLEDRLSKAQASWIAEKAQLEATHTSEVTQLVAIAQQSEGAALAAVEEIRQRFSQQQQGDLQNIQKAFESEIESLRRTHSEEIDSLKRDRASLERRLLDDKDVSVRGAVESALSDLTAKFDAERRAFQRASEEATSKVISEANDLVSNARLSAATDKENALADLQASHKAAVEQLYRQAYDAQSLLSNERDRALQDSASQLESTVSRYESQLNSMKEIVISAEASADRAKEEARLHVSQAIATINMDHEWKMKEKETILNSKIASLEADNSQAANIIAGLLRDSEAASQRADDTLSALRELQEASAKELSDRSAQYEASIASLRSQTQEGNARASQLELELKQVSESLEDRLSKAQASWIAEKAQLEATHTSEVTQLVAIAQQSEGAALAAVEEIRQRFSQQQQGDLQNIQKAFESEIESLRSMHTNEISSLRQIHAEETQKRIEEITKILQAQAEETMLELRKEEQSRGASQLAKLESEIAAALDDANSRSAKSAALTEQQLRESHQDEIQAIREDAEKRIRESDFRFSEAERFAEEQINAARALFIQELNLIRENSVPTSFVEEMRERLEQDALDKLQDAVAEAVGSARKEAEVLQSVLRQRINDQENDRKQLSMQLDMLQESISLSMDQANMRVLYERQRSERLQMQAEDDIARALSRFSPEKVQQQVNDAVRAAESWLSQQLDLARSEMERTLTLRSQEFETTQKKRDEDYELDRNALLVEKSAIEQRLVEAQMKEAFLIDESNAKIITLRSDFESALNAQQSAGAASMSSLRMQLEDQFERERSASEAKAREAIAQSVLEALEKSKLDHNANLAAFSAETESRFREFENEAENVRRALIDELSAKHAAEMELTHRQALADRDDAVRVALRDKETSLLAAQGLTQDMLDGLRIEHERALKHQHEIFENEKSDLISQAGIELNAALNAARDEMASLVHSADNAWQQRAREMLADQSEQHSKLISELQDTAQRNTERVRSQYEVLLMQAEQARSDFAVLHMASVEHQVSRAMAEGEADKIAALGEFNAEWVQRLEIRVNELMSERERELAAVRLEYQAQIESVVVTLENQRKAALDVFAQEAAAERQRLIMEKEEAVREAVEGERAIAARNLAEAMRKAKEAREQALLEQAAKLAEERAKAITAVRQQATEEQEEAMDALRLESEKLLGSIEGAMTKLRDERDIAREETHEFQENLEVSQKENSELKSTVQTLKRSGVIAQLRLFLLGSKYVTLFKRERVAAEQRRVADLTALNADWTNRYGLLEIELNNTRAKFRVMVKMRSSMQETLTSFKRDMLVSHKIKSTALAQDLATISEGKAEVNRNAQLMNGQLSEVEGTVRAIEKEMQELAKQSVIDKDGTVNVALTRKKKRLDRDMDNALVKLAERRQAHSELERKLAEMEDSRMRKEESLKQVEASLVATLVQQQRRLVQQLSSVPLAPEDLDPAMLGIEEERRQIEEQGMTEWNEGEGGGSPFKDKENELNATSASNLVNDRRDGNENQFFSSSPGGESARIIQPQGAVKGEAVLLSGMGNMSMLQPLSVSQLDQSLGNAAVTSPTGQSRARAVLAKASSSSKGQFWGQSQ
jgi:hypothetical protein